MKIILSRVAYRALWVGQAVAFKLRLWDLGASCVNGACAARDWGGWDWKAGRYAA